MTQLANSPLRALSVILLSTTTLWAGREFVAQSGQETATDELIIRLTPGANPVSVVAAAAPGSQILSQIASGIHLLRAARGQVSNFSSQLVRHPLVEYVEPNRVRRHAGGLPALNDPNSGLQWALTTVKAAAAWGIIPDRFLTASTAGSGRIRVAILDTGGDCTHNDFKNSGGSSVDSTQGGQLNMSLSQALVATTK